MGLGTSLFLIAFGAILDFAVSFNVEGFNIHAVGVILMLVGAIGAAMSLAFWNSWGGFRRTRRSTTVYDAGYDPGYAAPPVRTVRRVTEEDPY
jgi:hypothetical protein